MKRKLLKCYLFLLLFGALSKPTWAQRQQQGVYTTPGMPLTVANRTKTPYSPPKPTLPPPMQIRFWQEKDPVVRKAAVQEFYQLLNRQKLIPGEFMRANSTASAAIADNVKIVFTLIIHPNGTTTVIPNRQALEVGKAEPLRLDLLEDTGRKALASFTFTPAATTDTLMVPMTYPVK